MEENFSPKTVTLVITVVSSNSFEYLVNNKTRLAIHCI